MGGIRFRKLSKIVKKIWKWCETKKLWIHASYIPSKENTAADRKSRRVEKETKYSLSQEAFEHICKTFGYPNINLFASRANTIFQKYVSWKKDHTRSMHTID